MNLLSPYELGDLVLKNRLVLAPMTRCRAAAGNVPSELAATYYTQRAAAGLMVTEASQVSAQGVGGVRTPGIHSNEQVAGWRTITDAVHRAGGLIFLQLWHVGRVSHPDFHDGELPVAPSAVPADGELLTPNGRKRMVTPRPLARSEMAGIIEQFHRGAWNAKSAGFDGVEIHGANGYLLDQFLRDGSNRRSDAYGGSVANRARLPIEVVEAVTGVWGADRVGYKISPHSTFNSMSDSHPYATFTHLAIELGARRLAYLHVSEAISGPQAIPPDVRLSPKLRTVFDGAFIVNHGYDARTGGMAVRSGSADLVAYGQTFLANPDLPRRFGEGAPLNVPNPATFYSGEEVGYVDYPFLGTAPSTVA